MIHFIDVGVALKRPPQIDQYRRYAVSADSCAEATLIALQMASCTSVMPVWAACDPYPYCEHYCGCPQRCRETCFLRSCAVIARNRRLAARPAPSPPARTAGTPR